MISKLPVTIYVFDTVSAIFFALTYIYANSVPKYTKAKSPYFRLEVDTLVRYSIKNDYFVCQIAYF